MLTFCCSRLQSFSLVVSWILSCSTVVSMSVFSFSSSAFVSSVAEYFSFIFSISADNSEGKRYQMNGCLVFRITTLLFLKFVLKGLFFKHESHCFKNDKWSNQKIIYLMIWFITKWPQLTYNLILIGCNKY